MTERLRHPQGLACARRVTVTTRRRGRRPPTVSLPYRARMRHDQIALQLYTLRLLAAEDLAGTLRSVSAAGYRAVELAGLPETAPGELKRMLDDNGLQADRLARGHRAPARGRGRGGRPPGRARLPPGDRAVDARGRPGDRRGRSCGSPPSSAGTPDGWRRTASASAITTTTSSSAVEGTTIWDILLAEPSRPRSSSKWTSTGRPSAAAIRWPRSAPSRTASGCST